jgi:ribosomal protein S18 acetylase RimI-like enzyme
METRAAEADDFERITDIVERSMRNSYRLSPQQIEAIVEEQFEPDRLREKRDRSDTVLLVTETSEDVEGRKVAGFAEGRIDESVGELTWLFVDPQRRGQGIGTDLFDSVSQAMRDDGVEQIRGAVLETNTEGQDFLERFGLEHKTDDQMEVGEMDLANYVYADPSVEVEPSPDGRADSDDETWPDAERRDGQMTATTEDGQRLLIDTDDEQSGTEGAFYPTYADEAMTNRFGYYCSSCGSLDASMDNMNRIECTDCGNTHKPRSAEDYDDSYL